MVAKDIADTIISGIRSAYPPVISAIRKIAVIGACITPDIRPAIPTNAKLASGRESPIRFTLLASMNPAIPPIINVGPNVPPTPPPAFVNDIENTLNIITNAKKIGTVQTYLDRIGPKRETSRILSGLP